MRVVGITGYIPRPLTLCELQTILRITQKGYYDFLKCLDVNLS